MSTKHIDIIAAIRKSETNATDAYDTIGSIVNTPDAQGILRGIPLGVFQAIPPTWEKLLGRKYIDDHPKLKEMLVDSQQASHSVFVTRHLTNAEAVSRFKNKWAVTDNSDNPNHPNIMKVLPPQKQDQAQIKYLRDLIERYDEGELLDYRDIIMCNHDGKLHGIGYWVVNSNIGISRTTTNPNINETAESYLLRAGVDDPYRAGFVKRSDVLAYLDNYLSSGQRIGTSTIGIDMSGKESTKYYTQGLYQSVHAGTPMGYEFESKPAGNSKLTESREGDTVIGDIFLKVPPSDIRFYQQNQIYSVDTVRMSGNAKILNHAPVSSIDLTVFFNGKDEINTKLRPLIAQYRQTPFTILRNRTAFIAFLNALKRETLVNEDEDYDAFSPIPVVMDSITINTVPGYPDLIQAFLTLRVFNHMPYVPQYKFWNNSRDAIDEAIYSVYRNSTAYIQNDIDDDQLHVQDRDGNLLTWAAPSSARVDETADDPILSHPYRKTYRALLEDANLQPAQDYYDSATNPKLTPYTGDNYLELKYFSIKGISLRKMHFAQLLETIIGTVSQIGDLAQIASMDNASYQKREITLDTWSIFKEVFDTMQDAYLMFQQLRGEAQRLSNINLSYKDVGSVLDNYVYVNSPFSKREDGTRVFGSSTVQQVMKDMMDWYDSGNKNDEVKKVMNRIMAKSLLGLSSDLDKIKDTNNAQPLYMVLGWHKDTANPVASNASDKEIASYWETLASISCSYRNKLTPMPVHGYRLPTYQHLGPGEWSVSLNLKTANENLIAQLEDFQSSAGQIMQDQLTQIRGLKHIHHQAELMNSGSLLRAIGIEKTTVRGMDISNIDGHPGWFNINLEMVQDDLNLDMANRWKLMEYLPKDELDNMADDLFPSVEGLLGKYITSLQPLLTSELSALTMPAAPTVLTHLSASNHKSKIEEVLDSRAGVASYKLINRTREDFWTDVHHQPQFYRNTDPLAPILTFQYPDRLSRCLWVSKKQYDSLLIPDIEFYRQDGSVNDYIGAFVRKHITVPMAKVFTSLMDSMESMDSNLIDKHAIQGMYEKYLRVVADYFWISLSQDKELLLDQSLKWYESVSSLLPSDINSEMVERKRLSIARMLLVRSVFRKIVDKYGEVAGFPKSFTRTLNSYEELRRTNNRYMFNNYPDFEFPFMEAQDHIRPLGPAFPYVDHVEDSTFKDEYEFVEKYINQAHFMMAAVTGQTMFKKIWDNVDEKKHFTSFLTQLKEHIKENSDYMITAKSAKDLDTIIPGEKEMKDIFDKMSKHIDPKEPKPKASRQDLLNFIKTQSIIHYYTLTNSLTPTSDSVVVDIKFGKDAKDRFDPSNVKVVYKVKDKKDKVTKPVKDIIADILSSARTGGKGVIDRDSVEDSITNATHQTEQLLNSLYEAKMAMIRLCNVDDPESYTNFLGFTDVDASGKRAELRSKAVSAKTRNYKGSMYRAFPVMKIFFLEEDNNEWLLFDDVYNYNALVSCDIVDSKHAASQTAVIRLSNLTGRLSTESYSDALDYDAAFDFDTQMLRVGAPVLIKGGYGPDHTTLPILFQGAVTEIQPGEIMELTCQSWGVELTNPVSTSSEGMSFDYKSPERNLGAAVLRVLSETHGLKHFGRWSMGLTDSNPNRYSTLDEERAYWVSQLPSFDFIGKFFGEDEQSIRAFMNQVGSAANHFDSALVNWGNPLYDNIRITQIQENGYNFLKFATGGFQNVFSHKGSLDWKIYNQSVWDALWEVALFQGDYIVRTLPYNENSIEKGYPPRMTIYLGPRTGLYKCVDDTNFKPVSQRLSPGAVKKMLLPNNDDSASVTPSLNALKEYLSRKVFELEGNTNRLADFSLASWLITSSYNPNIQNDIKLYQILSTLQAEGARSTATFLLNYLENRHSLRESLARTSLDENFISGIELPTISIDTPRELSLFLKDPVSFLRSRIRDGQAVSVLDNIDTYDSLEVFLSNIYMSYDPPSSHRNSISQLLEFALNYNKMLLQDMGYIVSVPITGDYKSGSREYTTIREWMESEENSKLYSKLFSGAKNAGITDDHLYRPIVEHHFINSYEDILNNEIIATADHMFNKVDLIFPEKPTNLPPNAAAESDITVYRTSTKINPYLNPNYERTYTSYQKNLRMNWLADWAYGRKYLNDDNNEYNAANCVPLYSEVGNQILMNMAKPMYQGNLTLVGSPNIRPWHVLHLYDSVNQMHGPIEVEQVVHSFNAQTGFTTTITPNAVITHRSLQETWDVQYLDTFGVIDSTKAEWTRGLYIGAAGLLPAAASGVESLFLTGSTAAIAGTGGLILGGLTGIGAAYLLGKGAYEYTKIKYVGAMARAGYLAGWMPLTIVPLIYQGKPYLAGVEGSYWGADVYSFILGELQGNPGEAAVALVPIADPTRTIEEVNK